MALARFDGVKDILKQPLELWLDRHDLSLQLTNDEADWAPMGHTSFARKMNIELPLDRCAGTLDGILGGAHINFGFLLCGITPQNPPTGAIDVDQVKILTSFS